MQEMTWKKETLQEWLEEQPPVDRRIYMPAGSEIDWQEIVSSPLYAEMVREVEEEGRRLQQEPVQALTPQLYALFETTGNRLEYEAVYFQRRRRLTTFALLHFLFPGLASYRDALAEIIESILKEPTWCLPAHMKGQDIDRHIDLFAAETGFTLSEILTLSADGLPQHLRAAILEQVNVRLFVPYLLHGPYHWETADHNWAAVCAGSIGSAALLVEKDAARKTEIVSKAIGTMSHYLSGFGADGACLEGPGYWNYGFGYFVYFADLLLHATGGRANLLHDDKVKTIALFQQRCYLVGSRPANFSDALPDVSANLGLSDYLAAYYEEVENPPIAVRAGYTEDHCSRFAPALRNFLWFSPNAARAAGWQPGSWYFPDAGWLISRTSTPAGRFGFAAKGGSNNEPHNHIDVGHFILLADDDPAFAADLGSGEYTAQYFGEGRYDYDCTGGQGHSIPLIGGRCQKPGAESAAVVLETYTGEDEDRLMLEMAACYPDSGLASYKRRFIWHKTDRPVLELTDNFRFADETQQITEAFVTRCVPELIADGCILLRGNQHTALLEFDPNRFEISIEPRSFMNHFGQEESYYRIHLAAGKEETREVQLAFQIKFQ